MKETLPRTRGPDLKQEAELPGAGLNNMGCYSGDPLVLPEVSCCVCSNLFGCIFYIQAAFVPNKIQSPSTPCVIQPDKQQLPRSSLVLPELLQLEESESSYL